MPTPEATSRLTPTEKVWFHSRLPHPVYASGSHAALGVLSPNRLFGLAPQKSPPVARRSCCAILSRSQSTLKLPLASVHVRVALVDRLPTGLPVPAERPLMYLPQCAFTAVFPVPN